MGYRTQAQWDAERAEAKATAAKTIKSEQRKAVKRLEKERGKAKAAELTRSMPQPDETSEPEETEEVTEDTGQQDSPEGE